MYYSSDAVAVDQQPLRDHSRYFQIFFVVFIVFGAL
jgi:hypothetical protein